MSFNTRESNDDSKYSRGEYSENVISEVQYDVAYECLEEIPVKEKLVRLISAGAIGSITSDDNSENIKLCPYFHNIVTFAEYFVDDIFQEAEGIINKYSSEPIVSLPSKERVGIRHSSNEYPMINYERPKFSTWPQIKEFSVPVGADKIDEYLSSFSTNEEWLYIIYYLGFETNDTSYLYKYEAIWSIPSPEYPIAQATASVFFTIEVSKVLPPECLVDVTFVFESYQYKHRPGLTDFNEEWLNYILDSKIGIFKKIKF